eukprot:887401_1
MYWIFWVECFMSATLMCLQTVHLPATYKLIVHCFVSQTAERNSQLMYMNSYDGLLTIADCLFDGNQRYEGLICIQDGNLWNNKQFECVGDTSCVTMTRITYCM